MNRKPVITDTETIARTRLFRVERSGCVSPTGAN
jgi:hypothetical protein